MSRKTINTPLNPNRIAVQRVKRLRRPYYARPATEVAADLIGTILVHRIGDRLLRGRIVETEAYIGPHDLASHASKGRTARTEIMFGQAGHAYIYFIYGMYDMFNIVTSVEGDAQAVLVRAAEPLDGWDADLSGPGKLCRAFSITRSLNRADLTKGELFLLSDNSPPPRVVRGKHVGVDYSGPWKDELLRFADADSKYVSKPRPIEI